MTTSQVAEQMNKKQLTAMWLMAGLLLAITGHSDGQKMRCSSHVAKAFFMWCGMVKKRSVRSLDRFRTTRVVAVESEDSYQSPSSSSSAKSLSIGSALLRLLQTYDIDDTPQQLASKSASNFPVSSLRLKSCSSYQIFIIVQCMC